MYTIVWRYLIRADRLEEFEQAYGPQGDWVRFFTQGEGYVGTQLFRELGTSRRYLTVDEWRSKADYDTFRSDHAREYGEIDARCEAYTESEERLAAEDLKR